MSHINQQLSRMGGLLTLGVLVMAVALPMTALGEPQEKVTICHISGAGAETLTLPYQAVYGGNGQAGHFNEDGSPEDGHEDDYFGPCDGDSTTTTEGSTTTTEGSTTTTEATTTTTEGATSTTEGATSTTEGATSTTEATTTTTEATTTTTEATTTTTQAATTTTQATTTTTEATTTTAENASESTSRDNDSRDVGSTRFDDSPIDFDAIPDIPSDPGTDPTPTTAGAPPVGGESNQLLPYTGFGGQLGVVGLLILGIGLFMVYVTRGFGQPVGAHLSLEDGRFALGLHRGQHEVVGRRKTNRTRVSSGQTKLKIWADTPPTH